MGETLQPDLVGRVLGGVGPDQQLLQLLRHGPRQPSGLALRDCFGAAHVLRLPAGEGELRQPQGVGAVRGGLAGGDQFVGGGHRVPQHRRQLHQQIVRQRPHLRPVGDVGSQNQVRVRLRARLPSVVDPLFVDPRVKMVGTPDRRIVDLRGGGDSSAVSGCGGDGPGVHQTHGGKLALTGLGALPVGKVPGGVPEAQAVVGGHVSRAEAGTAEAGLDDRAALQQVCRGPHFGQLQADGDAGGVHVQGEIAAAAAFLPEDVRRLGDVVEQATGASGDDALVRPDSAAADLLQKVHLGLGPALPGVGLHLRQQVRRVVQKLPDGPGVGGMKGQGDHRLNLGEVEFYVFVIPGKIAGMKLPVLFGAAVGVIEPLGLAVGLPDGGQAGGLRGHHVQPVAEIHGEAGDAGARELQNAVADKAALKGGLHQGDGRVMGPHALFRCTGDMDQHHFGIGHIPGVFQKLLGKLRPALAHGHGAKGAVAGVGVGAQDHLPAACQLFPGVGVDDTLVGGDVDAAVLPGGGEAEDVVVLVDGAAYGAQGVVAVGQGVGHGELPHPGGPGLLNDANIGDVVAGHGVEADLELFRIAGDAVGLEDLPGQGPLPSLLRGDGGGGVESASRQEDAGVVESEHE